jgi:DNA-binding beta-propeller fold protein YncE
MKRLLLFAIILTASTAFAQREAYIVNGLAETLSMIDLETGAVTNHIVTLGETPNQVAYYDEYLYVVNSISADVMKINAATHQIEFEFDLPLGSNPYNIAFYDGYGYVTGWVSGKIYRLNLASNTIEGELEIGGYPEGLIGFDGFLYVTQTYFDPDNFSYGQGKIARIDIGDFTFIADYNVGKNPQWISAAPDGRLHLVCTGDYVDVEGSVYIFDPAANAVSDSILMGGQPANLAVSPSGIGYLAAGGWMSNGYVYSYDVFSGDIIRGPSNPINVGLGASSVAADSLGYVYSCNFGDDTVSKIDLSGNVTGSYPLGDGPLSITIIDDTVIGIEVEPGNVPRSAYMIKSYPNPFNGGTVIAVEVADGGWVPDRIGIFDIGGRLVKMINIETTCGSRKVYWNGFDNYNEICASGVYFARLIDDRGFGDGKALKLTFLR